MELKIVRNKKMKKLCLCDDDAILNIVVYGGKY